MDFETQVRSHLAEKAGTMHVPLDPYTSFVRRETQRRRTRRTRTSLIALALAGIVGVGGTVAFNSSREDGERTQEAAVPKPDSPEDIAAATKALLDSPIRGSLAGDKSWLNRVRTFVAGEAGDRLGQDVAQKDVQLLYAGEIGKTRQVVAYVPAKTQDGKDASWVYWFCGPAGDDRVKQMGGNISSGPIENDTATLTWTGISNDEDGYLLALGPVGGTITAGTDLTFRADGTVKRTPVTGEEGSGLLEMVLPPDPNPVDIEVSVTRDGETQPAAHGGNSWTFTGDPNLGSTIDQALGDRQPELIWGRRKPAEMPPTSSWLQTSLAQSRASVETADVQIPWAGLLNGKPAMVITVQEPGQGFLAFAWHGTTGGFYRNDYRVLMPAEGAAQRPIAYRLLTDKGKKTNSVNVIAPPGTTRLELEPDGQDAQVLELDGSRRAMAELDPDQAAKVTAYGGDGNEIGSSPVLQFAGEGTVGEAEGTRLVP